MSEPSVKDEIMKVLEEVRPALLRDGGDVEFVDFKDGEVLVKLKGACQNCPYSPLTLNSVIEEELKKRVKEVKSVKAV